MATESKNLKIKLSKHGGKKLFYSIIVADSDAPRDAKFIERVGSYNPMLPDHGAQNRVVLKVDRIAEWLGKGAQPTSRIARFLSQDAALTGKVRWSKKQFTRISGPDVATKSDDYREPTVWYTDAGMMSLVSELAPEACKRVVEFLSVHGAGAGPGMTSECFSVFADAAKTAFDDMASPVLAVGSMALARDRSEAGNSAGAVAALQVAEAILLDRKHQDLLAVIHYRLAACSVDLDQEMSSEYALRASQSALEGKYPVLAERALKIAQTHADQTA